MFEKLIEKNQDFILSQKIFRSYGQKLWEIADSLNNKGIVTISGIRHSWKTALITKFLETTSMQDACFYFNSELDILGNINSLESLITLMDIYIRIHGTPKIIVLQNTNNIEWIKDFISKLFKTQNFKIIIVWNNIRIDSVQDIEIYPMNITRKSYENKIYWGIPQVRIVPDAAYKSFLLWALRHDIISRDILEAYSVKNIPLFYKVVSYVALHPDYTSLREMHRSLIHYKIDISLLTMIDYINAAINTRFLHKCHRYDVKNNNTINSKVQYFFWDVWVRYSFAGSDISYDENILFLELKSRWYNVSWWINGAFSFEIYAEKDNKKIALALDNSQDKNHVRKTARKLSKLWESISSYVLVQDTKSLGMRKFEEQWVQIITMKNFLLQHLDN